MTDNRGVSLYVHVPFCRTKCPYCAFYSFSPRVGQMERWCACVLKELEKIQREFPASTFLTSIYFGGGTPSYLPAGIWRRLLCELQKFPRLNDCEFTVEANPESLSAEIASLWKDGSVNRVSLGIQSLNDKELKIIARPHSAKKALEAVELLMNYGFRVSGDLIFGLPNQTLRGWHNSLKALVATGISHISVYQLTIEPESFWGTHTPKNLADGYPMYRYAQYYLPRKGLRQYEIASFARPGFESRHNTAYWKRSNVYAVGPAAWGFLDGKRFSNCRNFEQWASCVENDRSPVTFEENLIGAKEASEAAILALRTSDGIEFKNFRARYGDGWLNVILRRLHTLPSEYFRWTDSCVALSPRGMRVGNAIWTELIDLDE